jgi:Tol biopolymer transport system component
VSSSNESSDDRLESWKAIAAYLARGITTVQRWEQNEGLPVHRLPHAKKGSVFAFKRELEEWRSARASSPAAEGTSAAGEATDAGDRHELQTKPSLTRRPHPAVWIAAVAVAGSAVAAVVLLTADANRAKFNLDAAPIAPSAVVARPLANDRGSEGHPSLSPAGDQIVYRWQREGTPGLYIKPVTSGAARLLATDNPAKFAAATSPKWSPRGDLVAFLLLEEGQDQNTRAAYVVPHSGGSPRRLTSMSGTGLCWAPDGGSLAFTSRTSSGEPFSVFSISLTTGQRQRLTVPPAGTFGDTQCAFSPDGRRLAVARFVSRYQSDLYLTAINDGRGLAVERVTHGLGGLQGLAWTPDGRAIVFGSHNGLWIVPAAASSSRAPALLTAAGATAMHPTLAWPAEMHPVRLAYEYNIRDVNIWRWDAGASGRGTSTRLAGSTMWEDHATFSPQGPRISFSSNRTGANEIWTAGGDGSDSRQLTFFNGPIVISPRWSPDGHRLAFTSHAGGNRDVYVMEADGSKVTRLTWEPSQEDNPSWSRDGRWIYFRSDRGGLAQIWKLPSEGGRAVRVTDGQASQAFESPDGKRLYFVRNTDVPGLWSVAASGGEETFELADVSEAFWGVFEKGIMFLVADPKFSPDGPTIRSFDFGSRKVSTIVTLLPTTTVSPGFDVARDGRSVLWTQVDSWQSDVMIVDGWRP